MHSPSARYTVLQPSTNVYAEVERKKSRFLTVLRRIDSGDAARELVNQLRAEYPSAGHHCSAWLVGPDRSEQRAHDDGEPSGTASTPMLDALVRAQMPSGAADLSDAAVVVMRWFGGTLLGAGGLVGAYSDSVVSAIREARTEGLLLTRQRMRRFSLSAPVAESGRWENELRTCGATVLATDYASQPGEAVFSLAVPDKPEAVEQLKVRSAILSSGKAEPRQFGTNWVDL